VVIGKLGMSTTLVRRLDIARSQIIEAERKQGDTDRGRSICVASETATTRGAESARERRGEISRVSRLEIIESYLS
jgi:hypothetical protein